MRPRFVAASLGAHALLLLLVLRTRPPLPPVGKRPLVIELTTPAVAAPPASPSVAVAVTRRTQRGNQVRQSAAPHAERPATPGPAAPGPATATPGPAPDLFATGALLSVLPSPAPNWGGTTRRPSGGGNDRDEAAEVAERVNGWLAEAGARTGHFPPVWRDVERQIDGGFHPSVAEVTRENAAVSAVKQLLIGARPESGPTPRGADDSRMVQSDRMGFAAARAEQVSAARAAYEKPRGWKRVEIDAEVDADGRLLGLRVVMPSGQRELDRAALAAVKQAIERRPPRDGHVVARWAVEAAVASKLPAVGALVDEVSGRAVGAGIGIGFSFDERGIKVDVPFKREVHTRVSLLSIRRL